MRKTESLRCPGSKTNLPCQHVKNFWEMELAANFLYILMLLPFLICPPDTAYFRRLNSVNDQIQELADLIPPFRINSLAFSTFTIQNFILKFQSQGVARSESPRADYISASGMYFFMPFQFQWLQFGTLKGKVSGQVSSTSLNFTKKVIVNQRGQIGWKLVTVSDVSLSSTMMISRMQNYSELSKKELQNMLNSINGSVAEKLINYLQLNFPKLLSAKLDQQALLENQNITILGSQVSLSYDLFSVDINSSGVRILARGRIGDEDSCGEVPTTIIRPSLGKTQTYVSTSFFVNLIQKAAKSQGLDFQLDHSHRSSSFTFFIGDLYEAIPTLKLNNQLARNQQVYVKCRLLTKEFQLESSSVGFILPLDYVCSIQTFSGFVILESKTKIDANLMPYVSDNSLNFKIDLKVSSKVSGGPYYLDADDEVIELMARSLLSNYKPRFFSDSLKIWQLGQAQWLSGDKYLTLYDRSSFDKS